jgi:serralysin
MDRSARLVRPLSNVSKGSFVDVSLKISMVEKLIMLVQRKFVGASALCIRVIRGSLSLLFLCVFFGSTPSEATPAQSQGTQARNVASFIGSLGINVHMGWANTPYANPSAVGDALTYIGIHNVRDVYGQNAQFTSGYSLLLPSGNHVNMVVGQNIPGAISMLHNFEELYPGSVASVEGPNEVDNWPITYNGLTGSASFDAFQRALYQAEKADSLLGKKPVYLLTFGGIATSDYSGVGNMSAYCDAGNVHIYYSGGQPAYGWSPTDSTWYWTNWMKAANVDAPTRPVVVTETGSTTSLGNGGVSEAVQARTNLNALMDGARYNNPAVYMYELMESSNAGPSDAESHFGLFNWDGSAKPAAIALHNFTTTLMSANVNGSFTPGALVYQVSGLPNQWAGQILFQGQDGAFYIVIWAEPIIWNATNHTAVAPPTYPITVNFGTANQVSVYDPIQGTLPIQSASNANSITVNVADHPIILKVIAAAGSAATKKRSSHGG